MGYQQPYLNTPLNYKGDKNKKRIVEASDKADPDAIKSKPYSYIKDGMKVQGFKNTYSVDKNKLDETIMPSGNTARKARRKTIKNDIKNVVMGGLMGAGFGAYGKLMKQGDI